jgi:hypothetical protein
LRAAQRFFIISDKRFLPSGVIPPRLFLFAVGPLRVPFLLVAAGPTPNRAEIARPSRSLSFFKSATIPLMSNDYSSCLLKVIGITLPQ